MLAVEKPLFGDNWLPVENLSDLPPQLMIVIDTEEEFDWDSPFDSSKTSIESIGSQHRIQEIFRRYGIKPTYVVDYPVASQPAGFEPLRKWLEASECLIGSHLQPWVNQPDEEEINEYNSYPGNLPPDLERRKLAVLTDTIAQNFGLRPVIYKAGRYGLGPSSFQSLRELGYQVDLSPVPYYDLRKKHGPDFRKIRPVPYWIERPGGLLTIPLTRGFFGALAPYGAALNRYLEQPFMQPFHLRGLLSRLALFEHSMLTPEGIQSEEYTKLVTAMIGQGVRVFSLTYHSPSLMPGNTPYVRTQIDLKRFLAGVEQFLDVFFNKLGGVASDPLSIRQLLLSRI